ncbi:hypothetical protein [Pseudomonas umsongensis]|jgi:hypothetical protein|nr:hypothetical protein [Pseudomonas umsongensis]
MAESNGRMTQKARQIAGPGPLYALLIYARLTARLAGPTTFGSII